MNWYTDQCDENPNWKKKLTILNVGVSRHMSLAEIQNVSLPIISTSRFDRLVITDKVKLERIEKIADF